MCNFRPPHLCNLRPPPTRETGRSNGYRETVSPLPDAITSLCKIAYRGPLTPEDWPHFCVAFRELSGLTISSHLLPFGDFLNTGMAIRKEVLRRRGALSSGALRAPGSNLDAVTIGALDRVMDWVHARYPMKMQA